MESTFLTASILIALGAGMLTLVWLSVRQKPLPPAETATLLTPPPALLPPRQDITDGVILAYPNSKIIYVNERVQQFFGLETATPSIRGLLRQAQPPDALAELFSAEGTVNFKVGERLLAGSSLKVTTETGGLRLMIFLRETVQQPELSLSGTVEEQTTQAVNLLTEVNRVITASLDLDATLEAILESVGRVFVFNLAEITLWDEQENCLRPVRHAGNPDYLRELTRSTGHDYYRLDEGCSGWLATHRTPLFIGDLQNSVNVQPRLKRADFPFRSYLGTPLLVGQHLIGTLEMVSYQPNTYRASDLQLFNALGAQAASAIRNAQFFAEQHRRESELAALAEITKASESTADLREFYRRITTDIARLMGTQVASLLFYETTPLGDFLIGQPPFCGLPEAVVELYRLPVMPQGPVERMWRSDQPWISNNVEGDVAVDQAGFRPVADTAGLHTTLLAPINLGGRRLGAVQVCDKINNTLFTDADARLLMTFATQAAAILENARLVGEAQARVEQAEGLRHIAVFISGATSLDEVLGATMQQIADLLHIDFGIILLLDEASGELTPQPASLYGDPTASIEPLRVRSDDPYFAVSITRQRRPFLTSNINENQQLSGFYRAALDQYQLQSAMAVPVIAGEDSLGEIIVGARRQNAFNRADQQLLLTITAQLVYGVERMRLYASTDQNLQRRVNQLTALTRIGRELNQTMELERILRLVLDEVRRATHADCGTITLLDERQANAVELRIGEEDLGLELTPLEEERLSSRGDHAVRLQDLSDDSPEAAHPAVRSALIVPILVQGSIAGLIHLHSLQLAGFDQPAEEITTAIAAQTAIAVSNVRRYREQIARNELLRRRADQLAQLFQISRAVRSDQPLNANLETIAFGMQEATGFNSLLFCTLNPNTQRLGYVASAGVPLALLETSQRGPHWNRVAEMFQPEFRISQSYFIPHDKAADYSASLEGLPVAHPLSEEQHRPAEWHAGDLFVVPLIGSGNQPVGLLLLDNPRDGQWPDQRSTEIVETFANQAALAIENANLFQAAERRASRLLALHHVIEQASRVPDRNQAWQVLAETLVEGMGLDLCLIALTETANLSDMTIRGHAGSFRNAEIDFAPLLISEAGESKLIAPDGGGEPLLVLDTRETAWAMHPLMLIAEIASFVCAPIVSQGQTVGVLFTGIHLPPTPFSPEDHDLFVIITNQLGAWVDSARLETATQTERNQRTAQLAALSDVARVISAALRTEDVIRTIMAPNGLRSVVDYDSLTLWQRSGKQLRITAANGFENNAERVGLRVEISDSALFTEMARTGQPIVVPDVRSDPRFPAGEFSPTRSWLSAPMISKDEILGALALDKVEANAYPPQVAQVLMAFANQAAIALENARLFEENEQRTQELDQRSQRLGLLNRVSAQLGSTLDEKRILEIALNEVTTALNVKRAVVLTRDFLGRAGVAALVPSSAATPSGFDLPNPALVRVYENRAPLAIEDIAQDALVAPVRALLAARSVKSLLLLPLVAADTTVAVIQLEVTQTTRRFTPSEIELAQTLANQAAVAVQNARLYNETQDRLSELSSLNRISQIISSSLDIKQIYEAIREHVTGIMGVDSIYLALYDEATDELSLPLLVERGQRLTLGARPASGLAAHILHSRQALLLNGTPEEVDEQYQRLGAVHIGSGSARSYLGVPLIIGERVIGVLAVQDLERSHAFTTNHERILTIIAAQVAVAVENARFAQELEARVVARTQDMEHARERVETLLQITTELSSSLDLDLVLARTLQLVTEAVKAPQGSIYLLDTDNNRLIYRAALGSAKILPRDGEVAPFRPNEGLAGWVIKNRQGAVIPDLETDQRWKKLPNPLYKHKSALAVPLMAGEDALGAMILLSSERQAFDEDQLRLVVAAANQVGAAINNAELYRLIANQAERLGGMLRDQQVEATKSRAILEGIADGVFVTDASGQVILFNAACETLLELPRDRVVNRPVAEIVGIYGAAGKDWLNAITKWSRVPPTRRTGETVSTRVELQNKRIFSIHLAPVTTSDEYLGSVSVIRDITRDVEVDRLKSEFVTNVSHELRTPMTAIKGYADILLMGAVGQLADQQARFVDVIKNNADRLSILVNDLLDISHIESGRVQLVRRPLEIGQILQAVVDTLKGRISQANKPMNIQTDIPVELPYVWGDSDRVTQILMNLADNAFNYSPAGSLITLRAHADVERDEMIVEVEDSGIGITPEEQQRLFDRFYRGEDALVLATPGNGLGLSIARQLAEMHGGRVWLERSSAGQGSTFALALPLSSERQN